MIQTLDASMLGIRCPVEELLAPAAARGFQAVSPGMDLLEDPVRLAEADALRQALGLSWGLLPMPADFYFWDLDDAAFADGLKRLHDYAVLGEKYQIRYAYNHIWPTSFRTYDRNFEWHTDRVRAVSTLLADHGIRYGLEFLGPHELRTWQPHIFVHTLPDVLAIADAAGGKAGIAFDCFHWYTSGARKEDLQLMESKAERLVCVHLNDAVAGRTVPEQRDLERRLPMETGLINSREILHRFRYQEPDALFMIEPFEPARSRFAEMNAAQAVDAAAAVMARLL